MPEVYCTLHSRELLEEVFKRFLIEETDEEGELFIISPWITRVGFEEPLVYHPYLDAEDNIEALTQLAELGKRIFIVTRYYDDILKPNRIYSWYQLYKVYVTNPLSELGELYREMVEEVRHILSRIEALEELTVRNNIFVRFNNRIHAKIYVGKKYAIIGSANFTRYALKNFNDECVLLISREEEEELYLQIRGYAARYFNTALNEELCERNFLRRLSASKLDRLGIRFENLASVKSFLMSLI